MRRIASIARAIRQQAPEKTFALITNAPVAGLPEEDLSLFAMTPVADRAEMATVAGALGARALVADTMLPPGAMNGSYRCGLILREMPDSRIDRLQPEQGKRWDVVVIPNPQSHWMPALPASFAARTVTTGWIYRIPCPFGRVSMPAPRLLLATGGGGTDESAQMLADLVGVLVQRLQAAMTEEVEIVQAVGPRAGAGARIAQASRTIDPGGDLNQLFADADAVISTSGYNSVLELAITTTPAALVAIPRTLDDQTARARLWGPRIGRFFDGGNCDEVAAWLATVLTTRSRREPVDIGPSGAPIAAQAILELLR